MGVEVKRRRTALVPGHRMWRVRRIRAEHRGVAVVRARHRVLRWRTITVQTQDLRYGYEAVARYLSGYPAGFKLIDSRRLAPRLPMRRPDGTPVVSFRR